MKVSPIHNSIVCAISPQAIVRQKLLAAASYVLVLCGAASAQSVPAAPPIVLRPAVEIVHKAMPGETSLLEHSSDLLDWKVIAGPVFADDGGISHLVPVDAGSGFYRLKTETFPETGNSRWTMSGCSMVLNSPEGVCRMTFREKAAGVMTRGTDVTGFTWEWKRDGLDTGVAAITWADGIDETMRIHFTGPNAGVFTSQRLSDGLPAGAITGTFRDETSESLEVSVPAALGDALVSFSGSGRPVSVKVSADGTGGITSPLGRDSYQCSYTVTGSATAEMNMTCASGAVQTWELTFTGPACGLCSWKSELHGKLRRTSTGSFTIAPQ